MRCWNPRAKDVIKDVQLFNPDEIVLMPFILNTLLQHLGLQSKNGKMFVKKIIIISKQAQSVVTQQTKILLTLTQKR